MTLVAVASLLVGLLAGYVLASRRAQLRSGAAAARATATTAALTPAENTAPSPPASASRADAATPDEAPHQPYVEVVDSVNQVLFRIDGEGRLVFLNDYWTALSGFTIEHSRLRTLCDFLHPDDRARARDA